MKQSIIIQLLILLLAPCETLHGLGRYVRYYTINEGMQSNTVYSITQDSKGRIWMGTIDGLHSFDGSNIRVWRDERCLSLGSNIFTTLEDSQNRLWIGSDGGVALFDLRTEHFSQLQATGNSNIAMPVSTLMMDSQKRIWIGTMGQGVFRYTPENNLLKQYSAIGGINSDYIAHLFEDSAGRIWAATTNEGLSLLDPQKERFIPFNTDDKKDLTTLFEDSQKNLWVGSYRDGLYLLDFEHKTLKHKLPPSQANGVFQIRCMAEAYEGELLIASDEGLTLYHTDTGERTVFKANPGKPNGLNDNCLQTLFIDREHALWIGTYFGGANYVPDTMCNFRYYNQSNSGLTSNLISALAHADHDNLWIGTDDAGFFYWNRKENTFRSFLSEHTQAHGPTYHNIHALLQDGNKLYIGMYMGGLDILDLKTGEFRNYQAGRNISSLCASSIYALYKDSQERIWIGTTLGLNKYVPEADDFERIYQVQADISSILEDKQGDLWVSSNNRGVYRLKASTQQWEHFDQLPCNRVTTVCTDSAGKLWLGTNGYGLLSFDEDARQFSRIPLGDDLRVIQKIIAAGNELWMTTSNGMYAYHTVSGNIRKYNKEDGLQSNQFLPNSGIQTEDGTIFVGGINGFDIFHPEHIVQDKRVSEVILTDFQLYNKPVDINTEDSPLSVSITYADKLVLKHQHSIFGFSVTTPSYINPTKHLYRYKLEGFEKQWTETNVAPHVRYTNLPAGNYTFRVSHSCGDGIWDEHAVTLPIRVLPPWWASTICILAYISMVLALFIYLYHRMRKKQEERFILLSAEKDKELYQKKIEFFTCMVHEIRTPLTLILAPLEQIMKSTGSIYEAMPQLQTIERNGKRLLSIINQLMDFRKTESGMMEIHPVNSDIKLLLSSICQRFVPSAQAKGIELEVYIPEEDCRADVDQEALTKVISNLLSNALKFADSHIWVTLGLATNGMLELSVKDNGIGIAREEQDKIFTSFYQVSAQRNNNQSGTGVGLMLAKRLTELMHGKLRLESELGMGSTFILSFEPAKQMATTSIATTNRLKNPVSAPLSTPEGSVSSHETHRLLIVDDNHEMVEYLKKLLQPLYQVDYAYNGKEALALAASALPELIISDVMMPVMDGIELCKHIKQSLRTSHIPILLLTAKDEITDQIEGLENGADFYLPKPFSPEVLKAQIRSLLANREHIKRQFQNNPAAHLDAMAHSAADREFLEKLSVIIGHHISDSGFNVDALAQETGISRTRLFTKIKAVVGMTPNDFIRLLRLRRAAELFAQENLQVSEVCFMVGFSSPSYFAKCFQAQFGVAPTEFKRKKHE